MLPVSIKGIVTVSVLGTGALLAGCQSTTKPSTPGPVTVGRAAATQAAVCPDCHQVWETKPMSSSRSTPQTSAVMQCENCTNAASNLLQKGESRHVCAACAAHPDWTCARH